MQLAESRKTAVPTTMYRTAPPSMRNYTSILSSLPKDEFSLQGYHPSSKQALSKPFPSQPKLPIISDCFLQQELKLNSLPYCQFMCGVCGWAGELPGWSLGIHIACLTACTVWTGPWDSDPHFYTKALSNRPNLDPRDSHAD
jgi:hypothetical protein